MRTTNVLLTLCGLILPACATPVAVDCPRPPPLPEVLTAPVSTQPNLIQRYDALAKEFSESLKQAVKP